MDSDWDFLVAGEIQIQHKNEQILLYTMNPPSPVITVLSGLLEDITMQVYKKALGPQRFNKKMEKLVKSILGSVMIKLKSLSIDKFCYSFQDLVGNKFKVTIDYSKIIKCKSEDIPIR